MTELENTLEAKEKELKNNEIELVARNQKFERSQAKVELLKGELARLHVDNRSLYVQLDEAKATATKAVSEYQSSAEMAILKQTIQMRLSRRPLSLSSIPRRLSIRTRTSPILATIWLLKLQSGMLSSRPINLLPMSDLHLQPLSLKKFLLLLLKTFLSRSLRVTRSL